MTRMTRDVKAALDEVKAVKALIRGREQEVAALRARAHDVVAECLASGTVTFSDISAHCGEPPGRVAADFREEVHRRRRAGLPETPKGGARPRTHPAAPGPPRTYMTGADIARMAGVTRAAVSNWKRRDLDFPAPIGAGVHLYRREAVVEYLTARGYLPDSSGGV